MFGNKKVIIGKLKQGKENGLWTIWNRDGTKSFEGIYKDGKQDGLFTSWDFYGNKQRVVSFKDGREDGYRISYYENVQKKSENIIKNGQNLFLNSWKENGKPMVIEGNVFNSDWGYFMNTDMETGYEGIYKDGLQDGLHTSWLIYGKKIVKKYENGQKLFERTYEDEELISQNCWDKDGSETECD